MVGIDTALICRMSSSIITALELRKVILDHLVSIHQCVDHTLTHNSSYPKFSWFDNHNQDPTVKYVQVNIPGTLFSYWDTPEYLYGTMRKEIFTRVPSGAKLLTVECNPINTTGRFYPYNYGVSITYRL